MPRVGPLVLGLLLIAQGAAAAEKQIRPFVGAALDGVTTFVDLENAARGPNPMVGVDAVLLGDVFGVEADVAWSPGFFQTGNQHLVLGSGVTTVTGSVVIAMPRRLTEYTLRPYLTAGAGVMHVRINDVLQVLRVQDDLPVLAFGAGAIGFLTNRVGLAWDVRRLGSIRGSTGGNGVTIGGAARLSFWRASMAVVFRSK